MRLLSDYAEPTSAESGFVELSAAAFGFAPTREGWFQHAEVVYYEAGLIARYRTDPDSLPKVGWWYGWLTIGNVTGEEACVMAEALRKALRWYREHPGEAPRTVDPFPAWDWKWYERAVRNPRFLDLLEAMVPFLERGGFSLRVRHEPAYAVILGRGDDAPPRGVEEDPPSASSKVCRSRPPPSRRRPSIPRAGDPGDGRKNPYDPSPGVVFTPSEEQWQGYLSH